MILCYNEKCKANIEQIVSYALDLDADVILTTLFPLGQVSIERRMFWSSDVGKAVQQVNDFIRSMDRERVFIFDTTVILADSNGKMQDRYSQDLLHLTPSGYNALNGTLETMLSSIE